MCLFLHKWGKWQQYTYRGKVMYSGILTPNSVAGKWFDTTEYRQRRVCLKCGKVQDEII